MSRRNRGFVLVNALVLVAALSAVSLFLLARAEGARTRLAEGQGAVQTRLYLDAFEALALSMLTADRGPVDHLGEGWATTRYTVPLDRGEVSGQLVDLQGRFNVNWLSNIEDLEAHAAFDRLLADLGLPSARARAIIDFVTPGGRGDIAAFARNVPAINPVGGPILMLEQLADVPGLTGAELARLRPYLAALPGDATLNVNTAPARVLYSLLPGASLTAVDRLIQNRATDPFASSEALATKLASIMSADAFKELDETRFGIGSDWFHAEIAAELEGRILRRQTVFERPPPPARVRVAYRLGARP
ncbi:type II secretion system minor pseudopilin GspK [Aestuariivita sp.]|jgi:general secretion pathway protein K|uniref:type II secretion system minor pseudopilin GspK n=1 Tax=Aestuariivita sp. TaxID=1872407 RepID=UPI002170C3FF|nr:type II secretion system minor pseudopilin GspK [Aestuariivita sp.]MCE8009873.1 type II secretion system minor pseudopilin GspK [Aestuariivita sp.]